MTSHAPQRPLDWARESVAADGPTIVSQEEEGAALRGSVGLSVRVDFPGPEETLDPELDEPAAPNTACDLSIERLTPTPCGVEREPVYYPRITPPIIPRVTILPWGCEGPGAAKLSLAD